MYVGRIVAIGCTRAGRSVAMYRVSSRSFPNRRAVLSSGVAAIVPKPGYESDVAENPYIAYNCLRVARGIAIATNGAQTDPIAEKIEQGMNVRDAFATVLLTLDFEKDTYDTPRIAAAVTDDGKTGWLGIVRKDALLVREYPLTPGTCFYVCTYEHNAPLPEYTDTAFDVESAEAACDFILGAGCFASFERPVSAACAAATGSGTYELAVKEAAPPAT